MVAGTAFEIGSYTQALTAASSYDVTLDMLGPQIRVYVAGVLRIAVTDPTPINQRATQGWSFKGGGTATDRDDRPSHDRARHRRSRSARSDDHLRRRRYSGDRHSPATRTPGLPAGVAANDLLLLSSTSNEASIVTFPAGWTVAYDGGGTAGRVALAWRALSGG